MARRRVYPMFSRTGPESHEAHEGARPTDRSDLSIPTPWEDGWEFLKLLRAHSTHGATPPGFRCPAFRRGGISAAVFKIISQFARS